MNWQTQLRTSGNHPARRLLYGGIAGLTLLAGSWNAYADSTFLLQLGTYDSADQASQKWQDVKTKNADVLGTLGYHAAEVSLPPDNATSYRMQAGPVPTREQAASLCDTLQGRGVECYVVETAMFTPDNAPVTAAAVPAPAPAAVAPPAPVAPTASLPIPSAPPAPVAVEAPPAPPPPVAVAAEAPPPPMSPVAPPPVPAVMAAPQPPVYTSPVVGNPAPAPLLVSDNSPESLRYVPGREPKFLGGAAPRPVPMPMASDVSEPSMAAAAPEPEKPGFFGRLFGSEPTPPPVASGSPSKVGNVNVAEAIRVPLSNRTHGAAPNLPPVRGLGGYPSQTSMQKTYWAQLSYFHDEAQARGFFNNFHAMYPQFSNGVRVRITRPYVAANSVGRVSLRIGPFAGAQDVRAICTIGTQQGLRCTVVRDMGASSAANAPSDRVSYHGNFDDRTRAMHAAVDTRPQMYWVQVGSYASPKQAWNEWKDLQDDNRRLLRRVHAIVTNPPMSSAARAVFRLRAGPYPTEARANTLCDRLQSAGQNCIIVYDR